jgi:peptide-methionine (S)-S-oxide reductase
MLNIGKLFVLSILVCSSIYSAPVKEKKMSLESVVLAGGCFWGMEDLIRELPGVIKTEVGYAGGNTENPTYLVVKTGQTGHAEVVKVDFNSNELSFVDLLTFYFRIHDPTTVNRQGNDIGSQYRSEIFVTTALQKEQALSMLQNPEILKRWKKPIVTKVTDLDKFYSAEEYHQDYLKKNPGGYTCHWIRD